jgi:hypothetical protein
MKVDIQSCLADVHHVVRAVMPERKILSRCLLVGAAIIRAAFPLHDRFFGRLLAWYGRAFETLRIFAAGVCFSWDRPISCFRCGGLN